MASKATIAPLPERLRRAVQHTDLDQADIARLLGTNPRTVSRWLQNQAEPRPEARRRLLEVLAVLEHLSGVLKPQAAHDWLFSPNGMLDHHKPVELLAEGEFRRVLAMIDALAEGVFV
jgi:putative toxin-antitoxin system antitoxin component (TIGR02293 family)